MPLERFGLRNEYSLGGKELYNNGVEPEDSKAVLNGVAVAGIVGLLRQLGDLSLFATEVFHDLQEQVVSTATRSRKLVTRIQRVEASLPSLETTLLAQTNHIDFAYTPGSEWHPRVKVEQNHFVCCDLPHFIMDSYEECREPPRLQLLDRFDTSGPGSCLKRYTDPTFFRKASSSSAGSETRFKDKSRRQRKARKIKRMQMSSQTSRGASSLSQTASSFEQMGSNHGIEDNVEANPETNCNLHEPEIIEGENAEVVSECKMKSEVTSHHDENIDSETDNFVDARNMIDSESDSDFETYTRTEVKSLTATCKLPSTDASTEHASTIDNELSSKQPVSATSQQQPVESSFQASCDDDTVCTSSYPHASWTNGTLFGVQPSKPTNHVSEDLESSTNGNGKLESSLNSRPTSPALEHMKISFRPIDVPEPSRLKLKYPQGVELELEHEHEHPSFQLVPELTRVYQEMGSDSDDDDDTFCRSNPGVSDDSAGRLSDSDSEQWEPRDFPGSNDRGLYDEQLSGISSTEFSDLNLEGLTPEPPPLPPLQWRVKRGSDSPNQLFDPHPHPHPHEDESGRLQSRMQEKDSTFKRKNEIKVAETKVDDPGAFLHQIRAKSFNLKRTDAVRSFSTPSPPNSTKITAILQKANAIRQVVGSDGEDDSWSDT